eukprot:GILI01015984.1.p1 GENE.GILI01015984.1~~GILI01015984.1.p1  ORF type:complete len:243 (-),score=72.49 GILI01015984.1:207-842(-)
MGNKPSIDDTVFQFKMNSKQLARMSQKAEKEHKAERAKIMTAMQKGNVEGARIYSQNAIRKKNESLNFLKLSSKMDAVASRLQAAAATQQMTNGIARCVPQLQRALDTMDVAKISTSMSEFERLFEDLDVKADFVVGAIDSTTSGTTPADQVDSLIREVADEHGLEVSTMLSGISATGPLKAPTTALASSTAAAPAPAADDLEARLSRLRQ